MMLRKLRARRGTTLSEMLVAVAILSMVSLAITVGVSASLRVYRDSVMLSDTQTLASTLTQALMDDLRFAREIQTDSGGGVTSYLSPKGGKDAVVGVNDEGRITISGNELVGSGAYAGLKAEVEGMTYDGETVSLTLVIRSGDEDIRTVSVSVRPLNPMTKDAETS